MRGWKDVYDEEMQRAWSLDDHVYKETSIESAKKDLDEWFGVEFAKVREQHEMAMLDKWQGLDSRMEKIRNDHDALLTSAIEAVRKRKGEDKVLKSGAKKGNKNLFSRMHKFYFSKLQTTVGSKMDVHNEQMQIEQA